MKESRWSVYRGPGGLESGRSHGRVWDPGRMDGRACTKILVDEVVWFRQSEKKPSPKGRLGTVKLRPPRASRGLQCCQMQGDGGLKGKSDSENGGGIGRQECGGRLHDPTDVE